MLSNWGYLNCYKISSFFVGGFEQAPFNNMVGVNSRQPTNDTLKMISFEGTVSEIIAGEKQSHKLLKMNIMFEHQN